MTTRTKKKTNAFAAAEKISAILSTVDGHEERMQSLAIAAILSRSYSVAAEMVHRMAERQLLDEDPDYVDEDEP